MSRPVEYKMRGEDVQITRGGDTFILDQKSVNRAILRIMASREWYENPAAYTENLAMYLGAIEFIEKRQGKVTL